MGWGGEEEEEGEEEREEEAKLGEWHFFLFLLVFGEWYEEVVGKFL